jgi:hypothetical protein
VAAVARLLGLRLLDDSDFSQTVLLKKTSILGFLPVTSSYGDLVPSPLSLLCAHRIVDRMRHAWLLAMSQSLALSRRVRARMPAMSILCVWMRRSIRFSGSPGAVGIGLTPSFLAAVMNLFPTSTAPESCLASLTM